MTSVQVCPWQYALHPGTFAEEYKLLYGFVFFSLPLMFILGIHETAHYIVARRYKVNASLPFFIPFPYLIGTFGAFVSLRDPVPTRKAMAEIGAAGPIAGFLAAVPLLFLAQYLEGIFKPIGKHAYPHSKNHGEYGDIGRFNYSKHVVNFRVI